MVGTGGEIISKAPANRNRGRDTVIEIGDRLVGIGMTHFIESMERVPGLDNPVRDGEGGPEKLAARAFVATERNETREGVEFRFSPLSPQEFSSLVEEVSNGQAQIDPTSIPEGTMVLSFLMKEERYTLARQEGSPGSNWRAVVSGERHWNVGIARKSDFWHALFPGDDVAVVRNLAPWTHLGQIRFGLSMLEQSRGAMELERVPTVHPEGGETYHDFSLNGSVSGTRGLETDFYIGLRTAILCKPLG